MRKRCIVGILIAALTASSVQMAGAASISDAKNKKEAAQNSLDSVNSRMSQIEEERDSLQQEIDQVDSELVEVIANISLIEDEIDEKEAELVVAEADLSEAQETEAEQYAAMKGRIRYMYENGNSSFFSALLGASSFADVLNKVANFREVYQTDRDLLTEYQETKQRVEDLIAEVTEQKEELEETEADYEEQQSELETIKETKSAEMDDFDTQLAQAESLAAEYTSVIQEQNDLISELYAAQAAASVSNVTAGASSTQTAASVSTGNDVAAAEETADEDSAQAQEEAGEETITASEDTSYEESSEDSYEEEEEEAHESSSGSGSGQAVADYACQFVGNPYVWGGTSLTNGADCSGFVMSVYAHFGVSLPHSSSALRSVGYGVSVSDIQPGDIVCYSGHVAIYIGGGAIVHASSAKTGIKISSNFQYRTIVAVRRIF